MQRSNWEANEDSPNQKEGMPFGGLRHLCPQSVKDFSYFFYNWQGIHIGTAILKKRSLEEMEAA